VEGIIGGAPGVLLPVDIAGDRLDILRLRGGDRVDGGALPCHFGHPGGDGGGAEHRQQDQRDARHARPQQQP